MNSVAQLVIQELDITSPRSDFEFETFFLGQFPTPARQMMGVMEEIIRVSAELAVLQNISVEDYEELEKQRKISIASKNLDQLQTWWQGFTSKERIAILKNFENEEPEYWTTVLGRQAALEILSQKQTNPDTMDKMIRLPTDLYETATRICNEYITMVTEVTESVEASMQQKVDGVETD
jgi:hypothetical protein